MPAIAKVIHIVGLAHIQSCQPYTAVTLSHHHSPFKKRDERKKINARRHMYTGEGVIGHRGR
jgi:hypothetical protein